MPDAFEIRDKAINVDDLMERIRTSIDNKKKSQIYIEEPWMMQDITRPHTGMGTQRTADMLAMLRIAGRLDLEGEKITSHRRLWGSLIVALKRITRFWVRRYTDAIFFKQNHFNLQIVDVLAQMNQQLNEVKQENEQLKAHIAASGAGGSKPDDH
ncbi:hypothetical protein JXA32_02000 [Candidatus Sumerlaeota bacterium]|nr:hypothetical protein [Candidatus Sumerlaeota bacterium]